MAHGNGRREAYTAGGEATLVNPENDNVGAFVILGAGAAPGTPLQARWTGPAGVSARRKATGWLTREPGRPGSVRVCGMLDGEWPARSIKTLARHGLCSRDGSAQATARTMQKRTVPNGEINKAQGMRGRES